MKKTLPAFTLIEILLAVAAVVILAAIVILAINPSRQLAQTRNSERSVEVKSLLDAVNQYAIDNPSLPSGIDSNLHMLGTATSGCDIACGRQVIVGDSGSSQFAKKLKDFLFPAPYAEAAPATGWISPTGYEDPGSQWSNYANAYDGNTGTYATNNYGSAGWGQFIVLTLPSAITSNRLRINLDYLDDHVQEIDVDVFKDGVWVDVFQGGNQADFNCKWAELTYAQGQVSQARVRYNYKVGGYYYWLYEFQFYQSGTVVPPVCSGLNATAIQKNAAILHGFVTSDGGEPVQYRFLYGPTANYGQATAWQNGAITSDDVNLLVDGLTANTTYHFQTQLQNSSGTSTSPDNSFTTTLDDSGWFLPLGVDDPDGKWEYLSSAIDDNFLTDARSYHDINADQWSSFIYLNRYGTPANGLRFYARGGSEVDSTDIDTYRNGVWEHLYDGPFADKQWVEKDFSPGIINQVRIRFHAAYANHGFFFELYEMNLEKLIEFSDPACLDLSPVLIPKYLVKIPKDPQTGSDDKTNYAIQKIGLNRVIIFACTPELDAKISAFR
jgi:type II secretory pathway pseudopilin PulG